MIWMYLIKWNWWRIENKIGREKKRGDWSFLCLEKVTCRLEEGRHACSVVRVLVELKLQRNDASSSRVEAVSQQLRMSSVSAQPHFRPKRRRFIKYHQVSRPIPLPPTLTSSILWHEFSPSTLNHFPSFLLRSSLLHLLCRPLFPFLSVSFVFYTESW